MAHPAPKKRGRDPDVRHKPARQMSRDDLERKLEEGLEETMAGSDPVSITQPSTPIGQSSRKKITLTVHGAWRVANFSHGPRQTLGQLRLSLC